MNAYRISYTVIAVGCTSVQTECIAAPSESAARARLADMISGRILVHTVKEI